MGRAVTIRRWLEVRPDGERIIHADDAAGLDYTLCGYAWEGACLGDGGDFECAEVYRGKINCPRCVSVIRYAKSVPARIVGQPS